MLNPYRTHTCGALTLKNAGETVRLSGWIHRKRDHGQLLFIDLRDHYGITQCVIDSENPHFKEAENIRYFGKAYQSYMKRTKMVIPFLF